MPSGNAYLLVFVDYFLKWIEVCAVREATAKVMAGKFVSEVFVRHGTPTYLISDRGTPFVSELFENVTSTLGSVHRLTTAYHPQTNGHSKRPYVPMLETSIHRGISFSPISALCSVQPPMKAQDSVPP